MAGDPRTKSVFTAWSIDDCLEHKSIFQGETNQQVNDQPEDAGIDTMEITEDYWGALNPPPNVHIHIADDLRQQWIKGYQTDPILAKTWHDPASLAENWKQGQRFFKTDEGPPQAPPFDVPVGLEGPFF